MIKLNVSIRSISYLDRMHFDELRYLPAFLAVCEEKGFRRAADKLNLSQPAVSYQIRSLESLLQMRLFQRAGRTAVLTDSGKMLLDFCKRSLGDFSALRTELRTGQFGHRGTLKIAAVSGFGRYVLFPILARAFADRRIELRYPTQDEVLRFVAAGLCDVGVVYESKVSSALDCVSIGREELVLIAPRPVKLAELEEQPFITYDESEYVFGKWMLAHFAAQPKIRSVAHFEELEEVTEFVRLGHGLSIVPDHCARGLHVVRPRGKRVTNELFLVTRAGSHPNADVEELISLLRAATSQYSRR